jgi:predicted pyridoxine 5'-phosphate oxidase superfamily flavin-nucleotide-binding protein
MPNRTGNRRSDTILNSVENPDVGLLFMVPGIDETFRVSGSVCVTADPGLLKSLAMEGKVPLAGFLVAVEEAFFQCGKRSYRPDDSI